MAAADGQRAPERGAAHVAGTAAYSSSLSLEARARHRFMPGPDASIVITSRNRREELLHVLRSIEHQTAALEVLVILDGSDDVTAAAVRRELPGVRLEQDHHRGLIAQRNRGAKAVSAPIVIFLDDDSDLPSERTIEQTLAGFGDARVGAVGIPYLQPESGSRVRQLAGPGPGYWLTDHFLGCACAVAAMPSSRSAASTRPCSCRARNRTSAPACCGTVS